MAQLARLRPWLVLLAWACFPLTEAWAGRIVGTTQTSDGRTITKVKVELSSAQGRGFWTTQSDDQGVFEFADIPRGGHVLQARKSGWVDAWQPIYVPDSDVDKPAEVRIVMELTLWRKSLAQLQRGILVYVVMFGLLVLVVNYWVTPAPSRELAVAGWGAMGFSVFVALLKMLWVEAALLALASAVAGSTIASFGRRSARRRVAEAEVAASRQEADRRKEQDDLEAMVGQSGITLSDLRACGTADFAGRVLEVRALEGYLPHGTAVTVRSVEGRTLLVQRQPCEAGAQPVPSHSA